MLNDVKVAIRLVSSDDTVLEVTPEVLQALMLMPPSEPEDYVTPIIPAKNIAVTADEKKIIRSLRSFSGGCCGGINGLCPAHLLDLVAVSTAEAGVHLRRSITNLTNRILLGDVSDYAVKLLFTSNVTTLRKKDGGTHCRPVAGGTHCRPVAGGTHCRPVAGGTHCRPVAGGTHCRPVAGGTHCRPVAGGTHCRPVAGGTHCRPLPVGNVFSG